VLDFLVDQADQVMAWPVLDLDTLVLLPLSILLQEHRVIPDQEPVAVAVLAEPAVRDMSGHTPAVLTVLVQPVLAPAAVQEEPILVKVVLVAVSVQGVLVALE
jgi:hypothetical protein